MAITWINAESSCPPCDPDTCLPVDTCLAGTVTDVCGCCQVKNAQINELAIKIFDDFAYFSCPPQKSPPLVEIEL